MDVSTQIFLKTNLDDITLEQISELQRVISHHRRLYNEESPVISDKEYDDLYRLLVQAEEKYGITDTTSPTQSVDHLVSSQFQKVRHAHQMASLDNTYNADDLRDFQTRIHNILKKNTQSGILNSESKLEYMVELKFDGLGIALTYEHGELARAVTRGDGVEGEDITVNIMQIKAVPKKIASNESSIEIRGEIIMPIVSFEKLNASRLEKGEPLFANPRNAASGSVRQKDYNVTASRELDFFAYSCPALETATSPLADHKYEHLIEKLSSWGFHTTPYFKKMDGIEAVISEIESMHGKPTFPFEIDGLVIKVNDLTLWSTLGSTAHHPRSAISYKFPATYSRTVIESIEHSVGRTGTVTPVANVTPVNIGGVMVRRATLHNYEDMEKKGVMIGDAVWIHRAGEVIPEIIGPISESRDGSQQVIEIPKLCPICETPLIKDGDKVAILCPNPLCEAKISGGLEWFVSKHGLDIDGLGPQQVSLFQDNGWVTDMASIFDLPSYAQDILALEGYKEKSVNNLIEAIEAARKQPVWKFIAALGISGVGKRTAKTLAPIFTSKEDFLTFTQTQEDLEAIKDIGPETARNIINYFHHHHALIERLLERIELGFESGILNLESGILAGKSFCVTGSFEAYSRDQIHGMIEEHGGEVRTSVSTKLDYLIAGEKAGSKMSKASELGVSVLSLDEFLEKLA